MTQNKHKVLGKVLVILSFILWIALSGVVMYLKGMGDGTPGLVWVATTSIFMMFVLGLDMIRGGKHK